MFGVIVLVALSGCAHYKPKSPLKKLDSGIAKRTSSAISFEYHIFSKDDCMRYLDRNVIAKGYQPVHITLTNNSDRYVSFSTANFSFPCVVTEEVAEEVHTNTVGRAVGYGVGALFIWPLAIPAIVDGFGSSNANKQLDADFSRKSLHDQTVGPLTTINGLVFAPVESFNPTFTFTLVDTETHKQYTLSPHNPLLKI